MKVLKPVCYIGIMIVIGLVSLSGCQKKVTKISELPVKEEKAPAPAAPEPFDTGSFRAADLTGDLLREAQEALQNIYFEFDKAVVTPESEARLSIIGRFMLAHPEMRILIAGNCDERGSSDYNMGLGLNRANAARDFLVAYGIQSTRIEVTSYGKERLSFEGCTEDSCHMKNRRDEFTVLQTKA